MLDITVHDGPTLSEEAREIGGRMRRLQYPLLQDRRHLREAIVVA
ncbi:hypothetical protein LC55x_3180 [Lysobacter capsici]|nr:hypothetical protein LC55x_3180 [Lysobacter capsici]